MESLRDSSISQVKDIPGLYISDRFAARSQSVLVSFNIEHILSVTRIEDVPKLAKDRITVKHIDIDDDPAEDILYHLGAVCDWIDAALHSSSSDSKVHNMDSMDRNHPPGVLVHCTQGMSRSGSFIIAYSMTGLGYCGSTKMYLGNSMEQLNILMRTLSLSYDAALSLAQESRPLIMPNPGFKRQLRIWEECQYEVYIRESNMASIHSSPIVEKPAYKVWKQQRDDIFRQRIEDINKVKDTNNGEHGDPV